MLLTGANGFIGQKLLRRLVELESLNVVAVARNTDDIAPHDGFSAIEVPDYLEADWNDLLQNVDSVIHVAGII